MRSDTKDLTGQVFGRLTVVKIASQIPTKWLCTCNCGDLVVVKGQALRNGKTQSCGCKNKQETVERQTTHGKSKTAEYGVWSGMKRRCFSTANVSYHNYGGRGITVCDRWKSDFSSFLADMGERPSDKHSIERLDNNGNYEPDNCKWATSKEQARNTRRNHAIEHNGDRKLVSDWAKSIGISQQTLQGRLKSMSLDRALTLVANPDRTKYIEANGKRLTLDGWAEELNISRSQVQRRLTSMTPDDALRYIKRSLSGAAHHKKVVQQFTKGDEMINEYESLTEAGKMTGINFKNISAVCNGKRNTAGGYVWRYK